MPAEVRVRLGGCRGGCTGGKRPQGGWDRGGTEQIGGREGSSGSGTGAGPGLLLLLLLASPAHGRVTSLVPG